MPLSRKSGDGALLFSATLGGTAWGTVACEVISEAGSGSGEAGTASETAEAPKAFGAAGASCEAGSDGSAGGTATEATAGAGAGETAWGASLRVRARTGAGALRMARACSQSVAKTSKAAAAPVYSQRLPEKQGPRLAPAPVTLSGWPVVAVRVAATGPASWFAVRGGEALESAGALASQGSVFPDATPRSRPAELRLANAARHTGSRSSSPNPFRNRVSMVGPTWESPLGRSWCSRTLAMWTAASGVICCCSPTGGSW